jgi:hypothetical protein
MGQMEMKCIFNIGKKNSILAKATQVSDMAHGPLVLKNAHFFIGFSPKLCICKTFLFRPYFLSDKQWLFHQL